MDEIHLFIYVIFIDFFLFFILILQIFGRSFYWIRRNSQNHGTSLLCSRLCEGRIILCTYIFSVCIKNAMPFIGDRSKNHRIAFCAYQTCWPVGTKHGPLCGLGLSRETIYIVYICGRIECETAPTTKASNHTQTSYLSPYELGLVLVVNERWEVRNAYDQ